MSNKVDTIVCKELKYQTINSAMCRLDNAISRLSDTVAELQGQREVDSQSDYPSSCFKDVYESLTIRANRMTDAIDSINGEITSLLSN